LVADVQLTNDLVPTQIQALLDYAAQTSIEEKDETRVTLVPVFFPERIKIKTMAYLARLK